MNADKEIIKYMARGRELGNKYMYLCKDTTTGEEYPRYSDSPSIESDRDEEVLRMYDLKTGQMYRKRHEVEADTVLHDAILSRLKEWEDSDVQMSIHDDKCIDNLRGPMRGDIDLEQSQRVLDQVNERICERDGRKALIYDIRKLIQRHVKD